MAIESESVFVIDSPSFESKLVTNLGVTVTVILTPAAGFIGTVSPILPDTDVDSAVW